MEPLATLLHNLPLALGPSWLDPESLIEKFSIIGLLVVVFLESGMMVGFFLPGDSLLFTAGLLSSTTNLVPDLWVLLIVIPMATPEVVIGASLLSFFLTLNVFQLGFQTLLIAHIMFSVSFVVIVVRSRLIGFDRRLEEAAADLGANAFTTFRKVTLPLIAPGVVSAAFLAFALSIDDFVISNFNSGSEVTFPLYIFGANQRGIPVQVNVIATMLFAVTVLAMLAVIIQQKRAEKAAALRPEEAANKPAISIPV